MNEYGAIGMNASSNEAKTRAGYSDIQWRDFYSITMEEMNMHPEEDRRYHYMNTIPKEDMDAMYESTNTKLAEKNIPKVKQDVFIWRMAKVVQNQQKKRRAKAKGKPEPTTS